MRKPKQPKQPRRWAPDALPWRAAGVDGGWDGVVDAHGAVVCRLGLNVPRNAEFIALACNAHADLAAALRACVDVMDSSDAELHDYPDCDDADWRAAFDAGRAALAKVDGK